MDPVRPSLVLVDGGPLRSSPNGRTSGGALRPPEVPIQSRSPNSTIVPVRTSGAYGSAWTPLLVAARNR